jgi:predicted nucleic acid-binding protein
VLIRTLALTQKHTATTGTRSLDLIHIATALELGAADFLSLDNRQRQAASAEGLIVLPVP